MAEAAGARRWGCLAGTAGRPAPVLPAPMLPARPHRPRPRRQSGAERSGPAGSAAASAEARPGLLTKPVLPANTPPEHGASAARPARQAQTPPPAGCRQAVPRPRAPAGGRERGQAGCAVPQPAPLRGSRGVSQPPAGRLPAPSGAEAAAAAAESALPARRAEGLGLPGGGTGTGDDTRHRAGPVRACGGLCSETLLLSQGEGAAQPPERRTERRGRRPRCRCPPRAAVLPPGARAARAPAAAQVRSLTPSESVFRPGGTPKDPARHLQTCSKLQHRTKPHFAVLWILPRQCSRFRLSHTQLNLQHFKKRSRSTSVFLTLFQAQPTLCDRNLSQISALQTRPATASSAAHNGKHHSSKRTGWKEIM